MNQSDVIVIGAGPAGAAAAIRCALAGLKVTLIERSAFPRFRPGETLHPGIEPLLAQLGVWQRIEQLAFIRHTGTCVSWGKTSSFVAYGEDERGPWRGLQVQRSEFDAVLLARAKEVGVHVIQPCVPKHILYNSDRVVGLNTDHGYIFSTFVVDATGGRQWMASQLGLAFEHASPPLYARYGYRQGDFALARDAPYMAADKKGWTWIARVQHSTYQWTRLDFDGSQRPSDWCPAGLIELSEVESSRGADVTWCISEQTCGLGFLLSGDAAFVLDPASSHGVLKAIMTGMMASECVIKALQSTGSEHQFLANYHQWVSAWFWSDVQELARQYSVHPFPPLWIQQRSNAEPIL